MGLGARRRRRGRWGTRRWRLVGGQEALRLKLNQDSFVTAPIIRTEVDGAIEQPPGRPNPKRADKTP